MLPFDLWLGLAMASVLTLRREMIVAAPARTEPAAPGPDGPDHIESVDASGAPRPGPETDGPDLHDELSEAVSYTHLTLPTKTIV